MIIFADGSALNNGKKNACGGVGIFIPIQEGVKETRIAYSLASTENIKVTNNVAELLAVIIGLEILIKNMQNMETIYVYTDSLYTIKCATDFSKKWIKDNWKRPGNKLIQNLWLIFHLVQLTKKYPIIFHHVRSHQQKPDNKNTKEYVLWEGNNIVDNLANGAATDLSTENSKYPILKWSNIACQFASWMKRDILANVPMPHDIVATLTNMMSVTQLVTINDSKQAFEDKPKKKNKKSLESVKQDVTNV